MALLHLLGAVLCAQAGSGGWNEVWLLGTVHVLLAVGSGLVLHFAVLFRSHERRRAIAPVVWGLYVVSAGLTVVAVLSAIYAPREGVRVVAGTMAYRLGVIGPEVVRAWFGIALIVSLVYVLARLFRRARSGRARMPILVSGGASILVVSAATLNYVVATEEGSFSYLVLSQSVALGFAAYAVWRWGQLVISPATAGEKIVRTMRDALLLVDTDEVIVRVNPASVDLLGYSEKELVGMRMPALIDKGDEVAESMFGEGRAPATASFAMALRAKDGRSVPVSLSVSIVRDMDKVEQGMVYVVRDLTEQKRTQDQIFTLGSAVEQSIDGIAVLDLDMHISHANEAFASSHGYGPDEVEGRADTDFVAAPERAAFMKHLDQVKSGGSWSGEVTRVRRDGSVFPARMSITLLRTERKLGRNIVAVCRDISDIRQAEEERQRLQEEFSQAQKLESIGLLAGGIAHDFNNALGGIMGNAELIRQRLEGKEPRVDTYANRILGAARRASELTDKLLAFASRGVHRIRQVDMHKLVGDAVALLEHTVGREIEVVQRLDADPCTVRGDYSQLETVVLNLAVNARDAMPQGGTLTLSTSVVDSVPRRALKGASATGPGKWLQLSVADTGVGMDGETLARLFEPFYSTKGDEGTGLGLASVHGTVRGHRGFIDVESEPGNGTVFRVYLPLWAGDETQAAAESAGREAGTVLVADDESSVRDTCRRLLGELGYEVVTVGDGADAVAYVKEHRDTVVLVLLDIIMPTLGGYDTFTQLHQLQPSLPVVVMTGFASGNEAQRIVAAGANGFLLKPFTMATLSEKVHDVLSSV
jgi:PAS domain S-box-containing protein